ncbi:MAG: N-acetylglucosamine kinase [Cyclobacteriaceae bacterium]|nr:N-acetylglucosamine kinase [Cyclobacteriaceae bacterium]
MVLVADSGGSKIEWRLLRKNAPIEQAHTAGFNPYYQQPEDLHNILTGELVPKVKEPVHKVFYYGTGVSSEKNQQLIQDIFLHYFPGSTVEVHWDLLAAARALCGRSPGIACILGTGSNSCLYNGEKIVEQVANLGWILADEGSGTYVGKRLIFDYFRGNMPANLAAQFKARYPFTREEVLEKVYQQERPGAFLASFMKFIFQHLKEPYCYQLVYRAFSDFFENNVMKYNAYSNYPVHFTGSVAFYFSDLVRQVGQDKQIQVKVISEGPIAGLALYHQKDVES